MTTIPSEPQKEEGIGTAGAPAMPYGSRGTSLGEAYHRGLEGKRLIAAPGSTAAKAYAAGQEEARRIAKAGSTQ